jgi:hypothetical protein
MGVNDDPVTQRYHRGVPRASPGPWAASPDTGHHLSLESPRRHGQSSEKGLQSGGLSISAWPNGLIVARTATTARASTVHRAIPRTQAPSRSEI